MSATLNSASYLNRLQTNTTPLHLAAINGHEHLAMLLIRNGASLTHKNSAGHNALVIAIMNGKKDVVEAIIESDHWRVFCFDAL